VKAGELHKPIQAASAARKAPNNFNAKLWDVEEHGAIPKHVRMSILNVIWTLFERRILLQELDQLDVKIRLH
jgi:hypothetical protein